MDRRFREVKFPKLYLLCKINCPSQDHNEPFQFQFLLYRKTDVSISMYYFIKNAAEFGFRTFIQILLCILIIITDFRIGRFYRTVFTIGAITATIHVDGTTEILQDESRHIMTVHRQRNPFAHDIVFPHTYYFSEMEGSIGSTVQHLLFDGDGLFVSGFDKIVETFYDRITHAEGTRNGSRSGGDEEQNLLMWKLRGSLGHHFRICGKYPRD